MTFQTYLTPLLLLKQGDKSGVQKQNLLPEEAM